MTIEFINALTRSERANAYDQAKRSIVGSPPDREAFLRSTFTRFPPETQKHINFITNIVLLGAFVPSALRIFIAGSTSVYALTTPTEQWQIAAFAAYALVVGLGSVMIAEAGQIAFTLASSASDNVGHQRSLTIASWLCTAFALVANVSIVKPHTHTATQDVPAYVFAWAETLLPPILALIAANVRKSQVVNAIADRYAAEQSYLAANVGWENAYNNADVDRSFGRALANALRDQIVNANRQSKARLRSLATQDWLALVDRERNAEEWYVVATQNETQPPTQDASAFAPIVESTIPTIPTIPTISALPRVLPKRTQIVEVKRRTPNVGGRSTGQLANAITENADATFTYVCPKCVKTENGYKTHRSATNALVSHTRHAHKKVVQSESVDKE